MTYRSLGITVGPALAVPQTYGCCDRDIPPPRDRARRPAHGHPPASGDVPRGSLLPRRRRRPAGVRGAGAPRVLDVRGPRPRLRARALRHVRVRAPGALLVQGARVLPELRRPTDDGTGGAPGDGRV